MANLIVELLRAAGGRRLRRLLTPAEGLRRHRYTLHKARVPDKEAQQKRQSWWGDEPRWSVSGTPPRQHNFVTPLVDGENFFGELQKALTEAKDYVFVAGWVFTPHFPLVRGDLAALAQNRLLELLERVAPKVSVRILLWEGAVLLFEPTKRQTKKVKQLIDTQARGDVKCYLDNTAHPSHCHHQKAIVIDGQVAFVGGMDLTTFLGDRYDTNLHPLRAGLNWHDVQLKLEGEVVADVEHNFRQRWEASVPTQDKMLPHREPQTKPEWQTPVQVVRTIPRHVYHFAPHGEFGILHAYTNLIAQAKRFIYLENQYLWSPHILDALSEAMQKNRSESFRVVLVLPAQADDGKWDNDKHVQKLRELDAGRGIVSVYSLYTSGPTTGLHPFAYRSVYVHAKVAIIDDEWLTVGSANLNNRGLVTDSEINALVHEPQLACDLRVKLWAEHLNLPVEQVAQADPIKMIDGEWRERAAANQKIMHEKENPLPSAIYPFEIGRMPGAWFLEEVEVLTFEH